MSLFVFFFKQKTAYEMRISDWSSDVCSSDLLPETDLPIIERAYGERQPLAHAVAFARRLEVQCRGLLADAQRPRDLGIGLPARRQDQAFRSEERRVGNAGVSTCRSRGSPYP